MRWPGLSLKTAAKRRETSKIKTLTDKKLTLIKDRTASRRSLRRSPKGREKGREEGRKKDEKKEEKK